MALRISNLYGMDVFTDSGKFLGNVQDLIIDVEKGEITRILLEPLPASKEKALQIIKQKSVLYKNVKSVGDVVVIKKSNE